MRPNRQERASRADTPTEEFAPKKLVRQFGMRSAATSPPLLRNPGPDWGYELFRRADRLLPRSIFNALLGLGTWIAVGVMAQQRRLSRDYLSAVFRRPARQHEIWRHFLTYVQAMLVRLRAAEGGEHVCTPQPNDRAFSDLMESRRPALLGTFHFGNSDLLGFLLGTFRRHVHMVRLRVGNSRDTHRLSDRFGRWVTYVWVNHSADLLFALKHAAQSGSSLALMCDRVEYSSKVESFQFLGARRQMPFTIYHLSLLFRMPVIFCLSVPSSDNESRVHTSPVFEPDDLPKEANLQRARLHFQAFLRQMEALLRDNPYLWFGAVPPPVELALPTVAVTPPLRPTTVNG